MSTVQGGAGNIVTNGLVLYLDAANTNSYVSGSTTWRDMSPSENNATLINGTSFNPENKGSILFDGIDDYVTVSNNIVPSNITLEFFYRTFTSASYEYLISNARDCCGSYNGYELRILNGIPRFTIWNSSAENVNGNLTSLGQIYHICTTYDGLVMRMYQNGVLIRSTSTTLGIGNPASFNLAIGGMGLSPSAYNLNGNIYLTRIYNRSLSQLEVLQNFNANRSRFGI